MAHIYKVLYQASSEVHLTKTKKIELFRYFDFDRSGSLIQKEEFRTEFARELLKGKSLSGEEETDGVHILNVKYQGFNN